MPRQRARIYAGNTHDAMTVQVLVQSAAAAPVAGCRTVFAHHKTGQEDLPGFHIFIIQAVVAISGRSW